MCFMKTMKRALARLASGTECVAGCPILHACHHGCPRNEAAVVDELAADLFPMKKNFPLKVPDKADARVLESVKNELRKYVQREQRKKLPEGFTRWDFACKVGVDATSAAVKPLSEVVDSVDAAAKAGAASVYVEILAVPGRKFEPDALSAE